MAAPAYVASSQVLSDTEIDASPVTTGNYTTSTSGHTLIVSINHERGNSTDGSVINISSVTRNGQSATRIKRHTVSGGGAANEVGDIWQLPNADVGTYPFIITYTRTGTTAADVSVAVIEYDGGICDPDKAVANYLGSASAAVATADIDCPADSTLLIFQCVLTSGASWGSASHGTRRIIASAGGGGPLGNTQAFGDYTVPSAGTVTGACINFTPFSSWSNGPNMVIAVPLENTYASEVTPASMVSTTVMGTPTLVPAIVEVLNDDVDADNYDKTLSVLDGNTFTLWLADRGESYSRAVSGKVRVYIPADVTLTFRIDLNSKQTLGAPNGNNNTTGSPWTHVYREIWTSAGGEVLDRHAWNKVTGYSYVGSTTRMASGTVPSVSYSRIVELALKPTIRASEVLDIFNDLSVATYVTEPPSCIAARASDPTLGTFRHARLTTGTSKNSTPSNVDFEYPAIRLGTGPRRAQWLVGQHAREDGATYAFEVAVKRLATQAGGRYAAWRERFTLDCYAVNLSGNYGGAERHSCESNGSRDTNRYWHTTTSPQVNAVKAAMEVDREGNPLKNLFDWHGLEAANVTNGWCEIYTTNEYPVESELADRVIAIIGAQIDETPSSGGSAPYDTANLWGNFTLGSPQSFTIEFGDAAPGYPDAETMYGPLADAIIDVMIEMADEGWYGELVTPAKMVSDTAMGSPVVTSAGSVTPQSMVSETVMGSPSLSAHGEVTPQTLVSTTSMGTPTLTTQGTVTPVGMVSQTVMGTLSLGLKTEDVRHPQTVESTTVVAHSSLTTEDVAHVQTVDDSEVSSGGSLAAEDVSHTQTVDGTTVTSKSAVAGTDVTHIQRVDNSAVVSEGAVAPTDVRHPQAVDSTTVTPRFVLTTEDIAHVQTVGDSLAESSESISPEDLQHVQTVDSATVTAKSVIAGVDVRHAQTIDSSAVGSGFSLVAADVRHVQTVEPVVINVKFSITPADVRHVQIVDDGALSTEGTITGFDVRHRQTVDNGAVSWKGAVTPADVRHIQTVDYGLVTPIFEVAPVDIAHLQTVSDSDLAYTDPSEFVGTISGTLTVDARLEGLVRYRQLMLVGGHRASIRITAYEKRG